MALADRSVRVVYASGATPALEPLLAGLERCHVVALELWSPDVASTVEALRAARRSRPWMPPPVAEGDGPGTRVAAFPGRDAMYDRVRRWTGGAELAVVVAVDPTPSAAREVSLLSAALLARPQDTLVEVGTQLELLPFPRLRVLSPVVDAEVARVDWPDLCRRTAIPVASELRGRLTRHARGWTYDVRSDVEEVARAGLSDVLGAALAAVVSAPGADVYTLHELARGRTFGWGVRGEVGPEQVEARVRTWLSRLRRALAPWSRRGLAGFLPELYSRRVRGPVDIVFDPGLPWAPAWPTPPTSSPTSTTGPSSRPGSTTGEPPTRTSRS